MLVKELMTPVVNCVRPEASVVQVALQMKKENIGAIPVCNDKGEVLGIITDRDITIRQVAEGQAAAGNNGSDPAATAGSIMSGNPITVSPEANTHDAAQLMARYQLRRLPVISGGRIVGMLSLADIARKTSFIDEAGDILSAVSRPGRTY